MDITKTLSIDKEKILQKRKNTCLKKYGVENVFQLPQIQQKIKKTLFYRYGVENTSAIPIVKEKKKKTYLHRFGVENPSKSPQIKSRKKETCLRNFGVEDPLKSEYIRNKVVKTCLQKYGVENPSQSEMVKQKKRNTNLNHFGVECPLQRKETINSNILRMKNGGAAYALSFVRNISKPQLELFELVRTIYPDAILNHPCVNYTIDIAIPNINLAIEYDSLYWHQDPIKDLKRQTILEQEGWKFIRYKNYVPNKEKLLNDLGTK